MQALNIPTTRSLAVVTHGERYIGKPPARGNSDPVARSHIRVGTFQFAALKQDRVTIQTLLEYN